VKEWKGEKVEEGKIKAETGKKPVSAF